GNLDAAERGEVRGKELGVEQLEAARIEPLDQMRHGHLRGVGAPMEHGFTEKGGADGQAVQPPGQFLAVPDLDRMGDAAPEQFAIDGADGAVDPGGLAVLADGGAPLDDAVPVSVD